MTWNTSLVKAEKVNIELWGYIETGEYICILLKMHESTNLGKH